MNEITLNWENIFSPNSLPRPIFFCIFSFSRTTTTYARLTKYLISKFLSCKFHSTAKIHSTFSSLDSPEVSLLPQSVSQRFLICYQISADKLLSIIGKLLSLTLLNPFETATRQTMIDTACETVVWYERNVFCSQRSTVSYLITNTYSWTLVHVFRVPFQTFQTNTDRGSSFKSWRIFSQCFSISDDSHIAGLEHTHLEHMHSAPTQPLANGKYVVSCSQSSSSCCYFAKLPRITFTAADGRRSPWWLNCLLFCSPRGNSVQRKRFFSHCHRLIALSDDRQMEDPEFAWRFDYQSKVLSAIKYFSRQSRHWTTTDATQHELVIGQVRWPCF